MRKSPHPDALPAVFLDKCVQGPASVAHLGPHVRLPAWRLVLLQDLSLPRRELRAEWNYGLNHE